MCESAKTKTPRMESSRSLPYLSGDQAEERRIGLFSEVRAVDVHRLGKLDLARSQLRVALVEWYINRIPVHVVGIFDHDGDGVEDQHQPRDCPLQVLSHTLFKSLDLHHRVCRSDAAQTLDEL